VHVVELDGRAIGYIQHYLVRDYPAYLAAVNDAGAAAVDFLIGDEQFIGKGIGPLVIAQYIVEVILVDHPGLTRVLSTPDPMNRRSIRALEKAGFHQISTINVSGKPERLLVWTRSP
jgi:RimJ/RimL family protein N-acetyltransferase